MNPLECLLAEAIPVRPKPPTPPPTWTPEEQDAHWNALCQAVKTPGAPRPTH